ncbi:MAG: winged helix-turn-helix domain-containing protein [Bryobacteraceae bacterium]|nr:winged helix-turn-helix domain-containing protein [Bryobacteraceae bacterium]
MRKIAGLIAAEFGVTYHPRHLRRVLIRMGVDTLLASSRRNT